jgi:hypothetical protein
MASSFGISILFLILVKTGVSLGTTLQLLITVAFTTICWILTAYLGPRTDEATLIAFYRKVHPPGPGWRAIRVLAGASADEAASDAAHVPLALAGWFLGCTMIWSALFTVGNFLYGRTGYAVFLLVIFLTSGSALIRVVRRIWR